MAAENPSTISAAAAGQFPGKDPDPIKNMTDSRVMHEILRHLRQNMTSNHQPEFSTSRLFGVIFQIFAIVALVWAFMNMHDATIFKEDYIACHLALTTAGVMQLAALTFFVLSMKK